MRRRRSERAWRVRRGGCAGAGARPRRHKDHLHPAPLLLRVGHCGGDRAMAQRSPRRLHCACFTAHRHATRGMHLQGTAWHDGSERACGRAVRARTVLHMSVRRCAVRIPLRIHLRGRLHPLAVRHQVERDLPSGSTPYTLDTVDKVDPRWILGRYGGYACAIAAHRPRDVRVDRVGVEVSQVHRADDAHARHAVRGPPLGVAGEDVIGAEPAAGKPGRATPTRGNQQGSRG